MAYIYKIENQINHKIYIGKTNLANPYKRWKQHQHESQKANPNRALYRAMQKYGVHNFHFSILEETDCPNEREQFYIQALNTYHQGYNETLGGDGSAYLNLPEQEICVQYLQGMNMTQIAMEYSCDRGTISNILYKHNIPRRSLSDIMRTVSMPNVKSVAKIDKNTNKIIEVYPSIGEAERNNKCNSHIKDVCTGKRKTCGGFKWSFI